METKLQIHKLDTFSDLLFHALDCLGGDLLPNRLSESPSAFEKYPRMLIALIQRHGVVAGFHEWSTKVLRDANDYRKMDEYPELVKLQTWMIKHKDIFDKAHLTHLKRSIYGRAYAYLYPRRLLVTAYANAHKGDKSALEEEAIHSNFRQTVEQEITDLSRVYNNNEQLEKITEEAEAFLVTNRRRYTWK